jgi:hypothetical protein
LWWCITHDLNQAGIGTRRVSLLIDGVDAHLEAMVVAKVNLR